MQVQSLRSAALPDLPNILNDELFRLYVLLGKKAPCMHSAAPKPQILCASLHTQSGCLAHLKHDYTGHKHDESCDYATIW